jgi:hypothetical protein
MVPTDSTLTFPPKRHNPHADLSREELERRLWGIEIENAALRVRVSEAEAKLDRLREAYKVLRELAEEEV